MVGASTFRNADKALRIASLGVALLVLHHFSNASLSDPGRNVMRSFMGLALKPFADGFQFVPSSSRYGVVDAVPASSKQHVSSAFHELNDGIERRIVFGLDVVGNVPTRVGAFSRLQVVDRAKLIYGHDLLSFRLKDFTEQAFLHRIDRFAGQDVFDKKRASGLWLLCIGYLKKLSQGVDPFDRFVVGLADLLGLVWVHRAEGVSKDFFVGLFFCGSHRHLSVRSRARIYESLPSRNFTISDRRWLISVMSPTCPQCSPSESGAGLSFKSSSIRSSKSLATRCAFSYAALAVNFGFAISAFPFTCGLVPVVRRSSSPRSKHNNRRTISKRSLKDFQKIFLVGFG